MDGMFKKRDDTEKKLLNEIESIKFKKQTMVMSIQGEIQSATAKRDGVFCQIGKLVYESKGTSTEGSSYFGEIDALNALIKEKENKISEITSRYDDEINMMSKMLQQQPQQGATMAVAAGQVPCPQCGAGYTPGVDNFCISCGMNTAAANPAPSPVVAVPVQTPAFCENCGCKYIAGEEVFCSECGQKLG